MKQQLGAYRLTILLHIFIFNFLSSQQQESAESALNASTGSIVNVPINSEEKKSSKCDKDGLFEIASGDNKLTIGLKNRSEVIYGKSTKLLSGSPLDQVIYPQTTWELSFYAEVEKALKSQIVFRNKSRWGNPNSIAQTTDTPVKIGDSETGSHKHFIGRQIIWIKEGWGEILLNRILPVRFEYEHTLKFGLFPFELGRGISLGNAYAVSPGLLNFYTSNIIDQFAPAALLHGTLHKGRTTLNYDLYTAVLENKSDSFDAVNAKTYSQAICRKDCPYRGFGKINYIVAAKLDWIIENAFVCKDKLILQPYILYNRDPEQRVEFPSDSSSKLYTAGFYNDYTSSNFEFGCEFAFNFGAQQVLAWDRNQVDTANRDGYIANVYSKVFTDPELKENAWVSPENKKIVENSPVGVQYNGKEIGSSGLYNGDRRFRPAYQNSFKHGAMVVADASFRLCKDLQLTATVGFASGDENPNKTVKKGMPHERDDEYEGFIGLQEVYAGKRVKSVFLIGSNKLVRPLSFPDNEIAPIERFASDTPGFSNLIYGGGGLNWKPKTCAESQMTINPNILAYWQDEPSRKFSLVEKKSLDELASKFLGTELNIWCDVKLLKSLKAFLISGIFIPGQHYKDIKGKPINLEQLKNLDKNINNANCDSCTPPILSDKCAFLFNFGFEYTF